MSVDASPPAQPPQMSPDKKWLWDGAQWRPIPVHEAAFPNWKGIGAGFTPEAIAPAAPVAGSPQSARRQAATPAYRLAGPAPDVAIPGWNKHPRRTGVRKYGVLAAGAAVAVALVALVSVLATLALTARQTPAVAHPVTTPYAGPTTRSDSAWAAYLVTTLKNPMADLKDTTSQTRTTCVVGMTSSCADTFVAIDGSVNAILPVFDKVTIPTCIAAQEAKLHADLMTLAAGEQLAYKGFHDNKKAEFLSGLGQVNAVAGRVQTEYATMSSAAAGCDPTITGP